MSSATFHNLIAITRINLTCPSQAAGSGGDLLNFYNGGNNWIDGGGVFRG